MEPDDDGAFSLRLAREMAYRAESDPLYFKEAAGEVPAGTWAAKRAEIRDRYTPTRSPESPPAAAARVTLFA